jgi:hypothetical protein
LAILVQGQPQNIARHDGDWSIAERFDGVDVLRSLAHVPSAGTTMADVALHDDMISHVTLHLASDIMADLTFWDYGTPAAVEPIDGTPPVTRSDSGQSS